MNGYTGLDNMTTIRIHEREWQLPCSCGGYVWVTEPGTFKSHSEPFNTDAPHDVTPWWKDGTMWRYEVVE